MKISQKIIFLYTILFLKLPLCKLGSGYKTAYGSSYYLKPYSTTSCCNVTVTHDRSVVGLPVVETY